MSSVVDELYRRLNRVSNDLAEELGRPISMIEALQRLVQTMRLEPSDFTWSMRVRKIDSAESRRSDSRKRTVLRDYRDENIGRSTSP